MLNINNLIANWKTTTAGVALVIGSITHVIYSFKTLNENDWTTAITGVLTGVGFIYAADSNTQPPTK